MGVSVRYYTMLNLNSLQEALRDLRLIAVGAMLLMAASLAILSDGGSLRRRLPRSAREERGRGRRPSSLPSSGSRSERSLSPRRRKRSSSRGRDRSPRRRGSGSSLSSLPSSGSGREGEQSRGKNRSHRWARKPRNDGWP